MRKVVQALLVFPWIFRGGAKCILQFTTSTKYSNNAEVEVRRHLGLDILWILLMT